MNPVNFIEKSLSYQNYPQSIWALKDLPDFSMFKAHGGRYDLVTAYARASLHNESSLCIDEFMMQFPLAKIKHRLPFVGGVLGWIGYDKTLSWHGLDGHANPIFSSMPQFELRYYPGAIVIDHHLKEVTLVYQGDDAWAESLMLKWQKPVTKIVKPTLDYIFEPLMSFDAYTRSIKDIQSFIREGRVYQLNFTQGFMANFKDDPFAWYWHKQKAAIPYAAYFKGHDYHIMSLSPECFITIDDKLAKTFPIKGTIGRGKTAAEDLKLQAWLKASEKNRAENIMIVDLLRNDFGKLAQAGSVTVPRFCELHQFPNVHHLVSEVNALLPNDCHPFLFAKACMPGGSITGAPKYEAMKLITELELHQRGPYCGHFLYLSTHGYFESNIMIRTAVVHNRQLILQAGGGIVIDSKVDEEYQECFAKIKNLLN